MYFSMQKFYYLILLLFSFKFIYSQNNILTKEEIDSQYDQFEVFYPESDEDVKKIEDLIESSKKIKYKKGIVRGKMNILSVMSERANYQKMLELISELETIGLEKNTHISTIYIFKATANKELGFEKVARQNMQYALKYAKLIEDPDKRHKATAVAYNSIALYHDKRNPDSMVYFEKKELKELEQISDQNPEKYISIAINKINTGLFYLKVHQPSRPDLAEPYFMEIYNYRTTRPEVFEVYDMPILCGVGEFYLFKGDYKKSVELFNEVLQREKHKKNPTYRSYAYSALADTYEKMKEPIEQVKYIKLHAALNDSLNKAAKKEVNHQFNKLVTKAEKKKQKEYSSNLKILLTTTISFILILALSVWLYWKEKNRNIHKKYEALITKISLEKEHENTHTEIREEIDNDEAKSSIYITDDTRKILLHKLIKFEKSHKYLRQDISLSWLENHLDTNTKYLREIIKIRSNKTFSNYINGLRIDYITRKLMSDPVYREYKIEYLSEECGFGSRQVFVIAFKKETGFAPSYFIENLKKDDSENRV